MSPAEIVEAQFGAYNRQDLDAFMDCFASHCVIADLNGAVTSDGAPAIRERYAALFARWPQNRAVLLNRIAHGAYVFDHEDVIRGPGERFQAVAVYRVEAGKIVRVDFAR